MTAINGGIDILIQALFEAVPAGRIDGSYDKLFEKMYDPEFPLRLLPPYIGSSDEEFHVFVLACSGNDCRNGCQTLESPHDCDPRCVCD